MGRICGLSNCSTRNSPNSVWMRSSQVVQLALVLALIGFGLGACFALSLLLTLDHRRDPREAGQLAAFVQGVGFLINAVSPWMTGWLRELTGSFVSAWVVLTVTVIAMLVVTRVFSPATYRTAAVPT